MKVFFLIIIAIILLLILSVFDSVFSQRSELHSGKVVSKGVYTSHTTVPVGKTIMSTSSDHLILMVITDDGELLKVECSEEQFKYLEPGYVVPYYYYRGGMSGIIWDIKSY